MMGLLPECDMWWVVLRRPGAGRVAATRSNWATTEEQGGRSWGNCAQQLSMRDASSGGQACMGQRESVWVHGRIGHKRTFLMVFEYKIHMPSEPLALT